MARLSLSLPDTLHHRLNLQARREGVPLNQLVVFLLAERSRPAYAVVPAERLSRNSKPHSSGYAKDWVRRLTRRSGRFWMSESPRRPTSMSDGLRS